MIVKPAGLVQAADEGIDAGQPRLGGEHVVGHGFELVSDPPAGGWGLDVVANPWAERGLHLPPVIPPPKFGDELFSIDRVGDAEQGGVADLGQGEHAVPQPRRQPRHRTADEIAGAGIGDRIDRRESFEGGAAAAMDRCEAGGGGGGIVLEGQHCGQPGDP